MVAKREEVRRERGCRCGGILYTFSPFCLEPGTNDLTEKWNWRAGPGFAEEKSELRFRGAEGH